MNRFESTVSALAYSIIRERCRASDFAEDHPHNRVVGFVLEQHGRMAGFLRWPLAAVTIAFDGWGILRSGRAFHDQPHELRARQIGAWRGSSIGLARDLVRFYESLVIFGAYSIRRAPNPVDAETSVMVEAR